MRLSYLVLAPLLLGACATAPQNMAVTQSSGGAGLIYRGELLWIAPIFVTGAGSQASYSSTAGQAAGLLVEVLAEQSLYMYQMSSIATSFGTAISGEFEERYRGSYCQYFIETDDEELVNSISYNSGSDDEEDDFQYDMYRSEVGYYGMQVDGLDQQTEDERLSAEIDRLRAQIGRIRDALDVRDEDTFDPRVVMVVNPCRDFELGETIVIARNNFETVLERDWMSRRPD